MHRLRSPAGAGALTGGCGGRTGLSTLGRALSGVAALAALGLVLGACSREPVVAYSLDTPPLILLPASAAGVVDERGRFREILCALLEDHGRDLPDYRPCGDVLVHLGDEPPPTGRPVAPGPGAAEPRYRVAVVPGMGAECFAHIVRTFSDALEHLEALGYATAAVPVGGRTSPAQNARQIRDFIKETAPAFGKDLILIGHSKGVVDALEALVRFPEIRSRVAAVVSIAGPIGGSPLADNPPEAVLALAERMPGSRCEDAGREGLASLGRSVRLRWLAEHELPEDVRYFSLVALTDPESVSRVLAPFYGMLSEVDPRNDGMVIFHDAVIPGSALLGYVRADHWAVAVPFARGHPLLAAMAVDRNAFPREVLLEAVVRHVEERLAADRGPAGGGGAVSSRR